MIGVKVCTVNDCYAPIKGRGLCNRHLIRLRRHGDVEAYHPNATRRCSIEGCAGTHHARGWCVKHWNRWRSTGDPRAVRPAHRLPALSGKANPKWVGDAAGYTAAHLRMWRKDPARNHPCEHCGDRAKDWAYDHMDPNEMHSEVGPYSLDPSHYIALCNSCHTKFDKGRSWQSVS